MFARSMRRIAAILGLSLLCCTATMPSADGRAAASPCAGRHDIVFVSAADTAAQQAVTAVACTTSLVRGLTPHVPIAVRLQDVAGMHTVVQQLAQRDQGYRALQQSAGALALLGAMNPSDNLAAISSAKYNPSAAAQYSRYEKILYIRSGSATLTPLDLAVISHEYERALEDQFFNLSSLLDARGTGIVLDSDARLAREAVVEGDAFTTMLGYAAAAFSRQQLLQFNQQLQRTAGPANTNFLQDLVGFPASQGTTFVTALRNTASSKLSSSAKQTAANEAVNEALRHPPNSTAEILNPALYLQHATPATLNTPATPAGMDGTWTAGVSDVMGAFGITDLLQRNLPPHSAAAQAAGQAATTWQADRWMIYQHGKDSLLIWHLRFSSAASATTFVLALAGFTGGRFHTSVNAKPRLDWQTTGFALSVRQRSTDVAVAYGSDKNLLSLCEKALAAQGFS